MSDDKPKELAGRLKNVFISLRQNLEESKHESLIILTSQASTARHSQCTTKQLQMALKYRTRLPSSWTATISSNRSTIETKAMRVENMQQDAINSNFIRPRLFALQMNIVVSLFANENDEKRVIRFKKIPANDKSSKIWINFHKFTVTLKEFSRKWIASIVSFEFIAHNLLITTIYQRCLIFAFQISSQNRTIVNTVTSLRLSSASKSCC